MSINEKLGEDDDFHNRMVAIIMHLVAVGRTNDKELKIGTEFTIYMNHILEGLVR